LGDVGIDGKILKWITEIKCECGLDSSGSGWGSVCGSCECGNELSGSIKSGEFFDWPSDY